MISFYHESTATQRGEQRGRVAMESGSRDNVSCNVVGVVRDAGAN
jgi:hypothetical protein